jgi:hypothetical protein
LLDCIYITLDCIFITSKLLKTKQAQT